FEIRTARCRHHGFTARPRRRDRAKRYVDGSAQPERRVMSAKGKGRDRQERYVKLRHWRPQRTTRRDAPVRCASCGRQVKRRARRQLYCSTRCRKRAHYAESVHRGDFSAFPLSDTALGTIPPKKDKRIQGAAAGKIAVEPRHFSARAGTCP